MLDPCEFSNQQLRDLVPYEPGKPIEDVARELGINPDDIINIIYFFFHDRRFTAKFINVDISISQILLFIAIYG